MTIPVGYVVDVNPGVIGRQEQTFVTPVAPIIPPEAGGLLQFIDGEFVGLSASVAGQKYIGGMVNFDGYPYAVTGMNGNLIRDTSTERHAWSLFAFSGGNFAPKCLEYSNQTNINCLSIQDDGVYAVTGNSGNLLNAVGITATRTSLYSYNPESGAFTAMADVISNQTAITGMVSESGSFYAVTGNGGNLLELI